MGDFMRHLILALIGLLTIVTPVVAGTRRPANLQPPATIMQSVLRDIRDQDNPQRMAPAKMFRAVDINHDGVADWIVDFEQSGGNAWCGTGGCRQVIFVSKSADQFTMVFDEQTREFGLRRNHHVVRLDIDVHGSFCGTFGDAACPRSFLWDQVQGRFVETANVKGGTRVGSGLLENVERAVPPAPVAAAVAEQVKRCAEAGGQPTDDGSTAVTVPDLNGDGLRDWISEPNSCDVDASKAAVETQIEVFVSAPGGFRRALTVASEGFQIDIATRPARFVELLGGDCGYEMTCAERIWAWDVGKGQLKVVAENAPKPR
jgi:hypothetical protein